MCAHSFSASKSVHSALLTNHVWLTMVVFVYRNNVFGSLVIIIIRVEHVVKWYVYHNRINQIKSKCFLVDSIPT